MVRIQLDLPDEQIAELDKLMAEVHIRTRKDLFNNALTLFQWAVREKKAGHTLASIDETDQTYKELVMPALERIPKSAGQKSTIGVVAHSHGATS